MKRRKYIWPAVVIGIILIATAIELHLQGRLWRCACPQYFWTAHAWSSQTSQLFLDPYSFTHVLIRDVAYDLLPRAGRRERHEHFARFFEESTSGVGEAGAARARHWRDAGDHERAVALYYAVRDGIRYNPFLDFSKPEAFTASAVLAAGEALRQTGAVGRPSGND